MIIVRKGLGWQEGSVPQARRSSSVYPKSVICYKSCKRVQKVYIQGVAEQKDLNSGSSGTRFSEVRALLHHVQLGCIVLVAFQGYVWLN